MTWISVKERLPKKHAILMVKLSNGDVRKAYFYTDMIQWLAMFKLPTSYFWSHDKDEPIDKFVTHWEEKNPPEPIPEGP